MISVLWQWGQCRICIIMLSFGWLGGCSASDTPREHSRPTPLKHPRYFIFDFIHVSMCQEKNRHEADWRRPPCGTSPSDASSHDLEGYEPNFGCPKKFFLWN